MLTRSEVYRELVRGTADKALQRVTPEEMALRAGYRQQVSGNVPTASNDPERFRFGRTPGFGRKFA